MSTALQVHDQGNPTSIAASWRTAAAIKAQREAIVQLMRDVMKEGIDYGTIPGTPKPTLYKPGSEKLLSMFRLAAKPEAEDLSTPDTIRYRVRVIITEASTGLFLGEGLGEASSAETKYQWRKAVCQEEWDDTPVDRRRKKWSKGQNGVYTVSQVRAEMEDVANTVLKMAKKRAQIDGTLTVTAASDVFSQDAAELKDAGIDLGAEEQSGTPAQAPAAETLTAKQAAQASQPAQRSQPQQAQQTQPAAQRGAVISESQARRFYAIWKQAGRTKDEVSQYLGETFSIDSDRELLAKDYEKACEWAAGQ
jgi:hypothetical protein